jgi:hypothetical protein
VPEVRANVRHLISSRRSGRLVALRPDERGYLWNGAVKWKWVAR